MGKEKKENQYYKKFGKKLRETRENNPYFKDMKNLSIATGIKDHALYKYEEGINFPTLEKFIKICKTLDKSPSYMLSPYLDLKPEGEEFLNIFAKMKELYHDSDAWKIIQSVILGLDIYSIEKSRNIEKDIVTILKGVKNRLLRRKL